MHEDHEDRDDLDDADLLGDMAPASFHAPDDWWRRYAATLDDEQLGKLRAGELSIVTFGPSGVERVPLVPPAWV